jgi:hypothetical protein
MENANKYLDMSDEQLDNLLLGVNLDKPIEKTQPLGNKLGDLKYEGFSYCEVLNGNNYIWYVDRLKVMKELSTNFQVNYI